mgnify:CR=1 FL=1
MRGVKRDLGHECVIYLAGVCVCVVGLLQVALALLLHGENEKTCLLVAHVRAFMVVLTKHRIPPADVMPLYPFLLSSLFPFHFTFIMPPFSTSPRRSVR